MSSSATAWNADGRERAWALAGVVLWPLHLGIAFPSALYLLAMTVFLFRPPDVDFYHVDQIAFGLLVVLVGWRTLAMRERIPYVPWLTLPMFGLIVLAVFRALREPFDNQTWSMVASKFVVPFVLMHLAVLVFRGRQERKRFTVFVLLALSYLVFIAIAFLASAKNLIFPQFILDPSIGNHVARARGPFLQAVANGVSLNVLGILALVLAAKHRTVVLLLWLLLPFAVLATMTRTVWIAFAASTIAIAIRVGDTCLRRACVIAAMIGLAVALSVGMSNGSWINVVRDRTEELGPVQVRVSVYEAGWAMFQERPLRGWTANRMYSELARRMEGYHMRAFYIHNTYLSLLIEFGLPGLLLYGILLVGLFRLARADLGDGVRQRGAVSNLRKAWPILLGVYLVNACFVDMVYQFVNGLMFTVAGMLYASREAEG